jgi:uncharacterized protein
MPTTDIPKSGNRKDTPLRALCVSIHDVAPDTWSRCRLLLQAIHAVANIPVTLLAVPNYHRHNNYTYSQFDRLLEKRLSLGDELALHGYSHLDEGMAPANLWNKFVRKIYTQGEAEFYAIDTDEARRRLNLGIDWFDRNHWPITGFVAPAWLLGKGSWQALKEFPFRYTTTMRQFHVLPQHAAIRSPSLVYGARNFCCKQLSFARNAILNHSLQDVPILRIGLHPNDVLHPDIVKNVQQLLEQFLEHRIAMTKISFTNMWQQCSRPVGQSPAIDDSFISIYCRDSQENESMSLQSNHWRPHVLRKKVG